MRKLLVLAAVAAALAGACSYGGESAPFRPAISAGEVQDDGGLLYLRDCAWCHGDTGEGTARAPEIVSDGEAAADFMLRTGRMPLEHPADRVRRTDPTYTDEQIDEIVAYVGGLGTGPGIPAVNPDDADLGLGAELYSLNCAACHSTTGIGGALTSGQEAPSLHVATALDTAEAMITGPGAMPVFGPETFDQRERDSIVAYVEYLQDPDARGGSDLGGLGPWSEGLVAWVVGLGACLIVIRLIGTRTRKR